MFFPKQKLLFLDDHQCVNLKIQVRNYTLLREKVTNTQNNTHVTYSVHLRGSYATETILMKKPYSSVGKSPGETVNSAPKHFLGAIQKFARRAPQCTYSLIRKKMLPIVNMFSKEWSQKPQN